MIVFLKAPRAGSVKTRLGRQIGMGRAAVLFRRMTAMTLCQVSKGPWRVILAVDPRKDLYSFKRLWGWSHRRMAQRKGDLGARMAAAMRAVPRGPVIVVGADIPGLRAWHLRRAFAELGRADVVIGPAEDGGYWLIGMARRRRAPDLFDGVRWSSEHALADTIASLPEDFVVSYLPVLRDIDDAADLRAAGPLLMSAG